MLELKFFSQYSRHKCFITISVQPYGAIRQRFWGDVALNGERSKVAEGFYVNGVGFLPEAYFFACIMWRGIHALVRTLTICMNYQSRTFVRWFFR